MPDADEAELLKKKAAYLDTLRALHRRERLVGFFMILAGFLLIMPAYWTWSWPHGAMQVGYGLVSVGWVFFIYVIWRRTAWRRANPFDPKA
jgi:uncharacterized membrane protein YidH (DUF202 family)